MKGIVLAGGYATRLWPITRHRPKMMLPMGETTVIDRVLENLETDDRIDEVFVSTNERFADDFRTFLAERDYEKARLTVEGTHREAEKPGVVAALADLVEREDITEDTVVVAGDNVFSFDVSDFVDDFLAAGEPMLAAYDVGSLERATSYGVVGLDSQDRVNAFQEKPTEPKSTLISIACYGFPAETLGCLAEYLAAGNNPDEPGWFLQWLIEQVPVHAFSFDGAWFDVGTPESYLDAVAWQLDGDSIVDDSATLDGADIGANVHVMAGATVRDTSLDGAVVFPDATVIDTELRRSIVDIEAVVDGVPLARSLVGPHAELSAGPPVDAEGRAVLQDD